jgi:WD40 repeat protein
MKMCFKKRDIESFLLFSISLLDYEVTSNGLCLALTHSFFLSIFSFFSSFRPACRTRVTSSENGITNAIDIYHSTSGTPSIVCSNNDQAVRLFDASTLSPKGEFKLPWAVNCSAAHPAQGRVLCVVGDDPEAVLLDSTSGSKIATLRGHYDFSFAAAWHPDGNIVATGNQDLTTRVYDLRLTSRPLCVLRAHIGAVRSLRFSNDGKTLAVAEPADYITLYDVANEYATCKSLDVFGEIAGIGFSPDSTRFYTAVSDVHYASVIQLNLIERGLDEQWAVEKGEYCTKK